MTSCFSAAGAAPAPPPPEGDQQLPSGPQAGQGSCSSPAGAAFSPPLQRCSCSPYTVPRERPQLFGRTCIHVYMYTGSPFRTLLRTAPGPSPGPGPGQPPGPGPASGPHFGPHLSRHLRYGQGPAAFFGHHLVPLRVIPRLPSGQPLGHRLVHPMGYPLTTPWATTWPII